MRKPTLLAAALTALALLASDRFLLRPAPDAPAPGVASYATGTSQDARGPSSYPSEWDWLRRTAPYWKVDEEALAKQVEVARALRADAAQLTRVALLPLTPAGPTNVGGRVADIEWDPGDANVAYAAAATGGVLKSTDGGLTWGMIGDALPNINAGDLAVDPTSTQTVWLGTGEPNGGHNNFPGRGVYKSTNGGTDWSFMGLDGSASIGRIAVDPSDGQRVFVAAQGSYFGPNPVRGLYRTEDGGANWVRVLSVSDSAGATDVVIHPSDPTRMLASTWERVRRPNGGTHLFGPGSGIWRSFDGGDTWTKLGAANGLPNPAATNVGRIGLALCPANPNVAFAVITNGNNVIGLWRSLDFGTTWVNRDADLEIQAGGGGFSWYFGQVRVTPDNCDRVYVLDVTFFRSDDAGLTFPIQYGYTGSPPGFHVDHHALAFRPGSPGTLLEGNDGGISRSTDAGVNWAKIGNLPLTQFYEIGLDLQNPARLYGGTQDNGTVRTPTGAVDDWEFIYGGDGFYVNVHPVNPDTIYAESQFGAMGRSSDDGANWVNATPPGASSDRKNWSTPVRLDPVTPNVVYYGSQRLWRSPDAGASWTAVSGDLTGWVPGAVLGTITSIAVSPADHHVLWIGTDDGRVWRGVETAGVFAWTNVTAAPLPPRWVTRVVAHPTDPASAWVTYSGLKWQDPESHVFATTNSGGTWTDVSGNLPAVPVNGMAVDPANPQLLFVGTDLGAYYSDNGGGLWNYLSPDLPLTPVYDLAIHPTARYLAVGTHGRSMYKLDLNAFVGVEPRPVAADGAALHQNAPNPFAARTSIGFTLARAGRVRLGVYDLAGRRVRVLEEGERPAGRHDVAWDGRDDAGRLARAGSYRYRLELPDGTALARGMVRLR
jgi:photosystem II stability/assembly factor-like uncharacterized protein